MVELFVEGQPVDLTDTIGADITYSLADIRTPDKRQVSYSKTLTLSGTRQNNFVFGYIYNIEVVNDINPDGRNVGINYNPKKLAKAQLFHDGILIFDGTLRLWRVVVKGESVLYEVSLFGKLFDIFSAMADKKLSDLDLSEFNHALTWDNIKATWENSYSGAFRYPLIDYGINPLDGSGRPATFYIGSLLPCLKYRVYIDKIFSSINSSYVLGFSDTTILDKILVTPTNPSVLGRPRYLDAKRATNITRTNPNPLASWSVYNMEVIDTINSNLIGAFDNTNGQVFQFSAPQNISFQYKIDLSVALNNPLYGMIPTPVRVWLYRLDSAGNPLESVFSDVTFTAASMRKTITLEMPKLSYNAGDRLTAYIINAPAYLNFTIHAGSTIKAVSPNDPDENYPLVDGDIVDMVQSVPKDVKQVDYIKDFIKMFNLYVTQNPDDPTIFTFTPQIDFYKKNKAAAINWSNKIDYDEEITFTPISQLTAKHYLLTWKADKDYWNEQYTSRTKEVYGQLSYISDTDVLNNTEKVEFLFSPALMQRYTNSSVICPAIYKLENVSGVMTRKAEKFNARLLLWGGKLSAGHNIDLITATGLTHSTVNVYPYAGHLDNPITPTFDLNFGATLTDLPQASENMFTKYWLSVLQEAANKDGKLAAFTMYLKPEDIEVLDFSALYKINDHYFRLNKIEGFNPFELGTCKVELIKVVNL
jgi:hypothetical protein